MECGEWSYRGDKLHMPLEIRKYMTIFLIIVITLTGLTVVFASGPVFSVSSPSGLPGQEVEISVSISGNPGIAMFNIIMEYDKMMITPVSFESGNVITTGQIISNIMDPGQTAPDSINIFWFNAFDLSADGELFTVKFLISNEAAGSIPVSISLKEICNQYLDNLEYQINNSVITVTGRPTTEQTTDITEHSTETSPGGSESGSRIGSGSGSVREEPDTPVSGQGAGNAVTNEVMLSAVVFSDLGSYPWAASAINELAQKGIIKGIGATEFSPGGKIKRADFVILIMRIAGLTVDFSDNFYDVPQGSYYYNDLGVAKAAGLAQGIGDNRFDPEGLITRQDMFVFAYRFLNKQGVPGSVNTNILSNFKDKADIAGYAAEAAAALIQNELIVGYQNNIDPLSYSSRAEAAVFIHKLDRLLN